MTWNEADHPRDELGRFTFSEGGDANSTKEDDSSSTSPFKLKAEVNVFKNKSPVDILYENSEIKALQEKINSKYRSLLLQILGDTATYADILYADNKELERKIKEQGLTNTLISKVKQSKILQGITEKMIGANYNKTKYTLSRLSGADVQGTLDLAHGEENMHNPDYIKDAIKLINFDDPAINSYKETVKQKVKKEFKDYGYDENTIKNIKGYYFKTNSEPSQRMVENSDFRKIIKDNKQNILSNKKFGINFPKHGPIGLFFNNNFKNSIGKAQVLDYYIDKQGNLYVKILDTYEFNKKAKDFLNKAGRSQMLKGNLKPYFSIYEVIIPKEELDKILNN